MCKVNTSYDIGDIIYCEDVYGEFMCGVVTRKIDDHYMVKPLNSLDPRNEVEVWVFENREEGN